MRPPVQGIRHAAAYVPSSSELNHAESVNRALTDTYNHNRWVDCPSCHSTTGAHQHFLGIRGLRQHESRSHPTTKPPTAASPNLYSTPLPNLQSTSIGLVHLRHHQRNTLHDELTYQLRVQRPYHLQLLLLHLPRLLPALLPPLHPIRSYLTAPTPAPQT